MRNPRRIILVAALAAGLAASTAQAHHSAPATYTGAIAGGGTIEFDVSADGTAVTRFKTLDVVRNSCSFSDTEVLGRFPITGHAFQGSDATLAFTGSFHTAQAAQGTVSITRPAVPPNPACSSGELTWTASTAAPPPPAAAPPPAAPGAAPADMTAPRMTVAAKSAQRAGGGGRIAVRVGCPDEACRATAQGTLSVPGAAATFRLGPVSAAIARGARATLALKLSKRARAAVRRALASGRRVRATLTLTVTDAAGNRAQAKRAIRQRR